MMFMAFGSFKIGSLAIIANFFPLFMGGGFMYMAGIDLNISTLLVASVCLGIAVDDTVHFLLNYYREFRRGGGDCYQAVSHTLHHTGETLVNTTLILVLAFGLCSFSGLIPNMEFGITCGVVLIAALVGDLLLLPAIIFWLDDFFFFR